MEHFLSVTNNDGKVKALLVGKDEKFNHNLIEEFLHNGVVVNNTENFDVLAKAYVESRKATRDTLDCVLCEVMSENVSIGKQLITLLTNVVNLLKRSEISGDVADESDSCTRVVCPAEDYAEAIRFAVDEQFGVH